MPVDDKTVRERLAEQMLERDKLIQAALANELTTRRRVDVIQDVILRGFVGRLKWLIAGK